jgi:hypothetical protein
VDNIHNLSFLLAAIPGHLQSAAGRSERWSPGFLPSLSANAGLELPPTLPDDKTQIFYALSLLFLDFSRVLDVGGNGRLGTVDRPISALSICFHDYFIL